MPLDKQKGAIMYHIVGLNEKEMATADSFTEALKIFYEGCIEPLAHGRTKPQNAETSCYIEVIGETASARMYYPYVFEFAIKTGLIKNDKLAQPLIEPSTTELIAAFSRAAVLQMIGTLGCH
jgi:hypothetical protein